MIWCSPSSPTRCSTSCWRTECFDGLYGTRACAASRIATVATITAALALVFFYAPLDADQGFVQKIFYIHVPLAIVSLCGFVLGGVLGDRLPAHRRAHLGHALLRARSTCR